MRDAWVNAMPQIQIEGRSRARLGQRALDAWFAPKRFESTALYEGLGGLRVKQYAPTGGDFCILRYGVPIADVRGGGHAAA